MRSRWNIYGIKLLFLTILILLLEVHECCTLNSEGLSLFEFKLNVYSDPNGVLENWNADHCDPCMWSGVECLDGKVQILNLHGCSLEGTLTSELGNLTHLRSLVLSGNHFFGAIPKEFGRLGMLEVLDLRDNNLGGTIPAEIGDLQSLRILLIHNNNFEESVPLEIGKLHLVTELQFDENLTSAFAARTRCIRKFRHCIWHGSMKPFKMINSFVEPIKWAILRYLSFFQLPSPGTGFMDDRKDCSDNLPRSSRPHFIHTIQHQEEIARRKLAEQSSNLAAAPANIKGPLGPVIQMPSSRSSGSFRAVPNSNGTDPTNLPSPPPQYESQDKLQPVGQSASAVKQPPAVKKPTNSQGPPAGKSESTWKYVVGICIGVVLLILAASVFLICRIRAARTIGPWKTGLSGQLQKAFVTGVPKLNRSELETACEDFSNIITSGDSYIVYKGTLSSGVEIAVISTTISSLQDWSMHSETAFRKKIDTFSRVNHKNFVNLIGYCEEDEPFTRMMVFEYAPNGSLYEHLHVEEADHLDWPARMRTVMGTVYCLQYMHELNPPVPHCNLNSKSIFLTDDYAAKITEIDFWSELTGKSKSSSDDLENSVLPPLADPETNVYSLGILLIEIISGKSPYSEEKESLLNWAAQYFRHDKQNIASLVDPLLKSFKNNELMVICEVIEQCLQEDPRKRPTIKESIDKLREAIDVSPHAAVPRLSPLWWAELELLSSEAA
ncbi:protein MALE DISCOVERER 2-like isoform X2 [Solanum dulcamara]|uniref:protein MALE DISCOVERER 2-like isoform X2 n=1 Tax=Solanum dulcamara TaxID=45834 RepID=UPI00248577CD|nr:protein MALE DISCOVERER 2-like isoform X2 [Solanum dulcamara]